MAGRAEFPTLRVTLSQASAESWFDWHESFVVQGNNADNSERNGSLSFLSADLMTELTRIELYHLGIVRLTPAPKNQIARVVAELYCEEMAFA